MKKKKIIIVLIVLAALAAGCIVFYGQVKKKNIRINPLFVSKTDVVGVDISNHQGDVDMEKLAGQGVAFVYMKATEGSSFVDAEFKKNWKNAEEAGIPAGAYHFFSFDSKGTDQAESFIQTVGEIHGRLIPAVDAEFYGEYWDVPPEKEAVVSELRAFIQAIEDEYGVKPVIYMSPDIYKMYLKGEFDDCPKWVRSVYYPPFFDYRDGWILWQYTDRERLEGTDGREEYIDLDVLNRKVSLESLIVP